MLGIINQAYYVGKGHIDLIPMQIHTLNYAVIKYGCLYTTNLAAAVGMWL